MKVSRRKSFRIKTLTITKCTIQNRKMRTSGVRNRSKHRQERMFSQRVSRRKSFRFKTCELKNAKSNKYLPCWPLLAWSKASVHLIHSGWRQGVSPNNRPEQHKSYGTTITPTVASVLVSPRRVLRLPSTEKHNTEPYTASVTATT